MQSPIARASPPGSSRSRFAVASGNAREIICPCHSRLILCQPLQLHDSVRHPSTRSLSMAMFIGEALDGEGNEIAHIDLLIGDKAGPVGTAFANALATQSAGHNNLLA